MTFFCICFHSGRYLRRPNHSQKQNSNTYPCKHVRISGKPYSSRGYQDKINKTQDPDKISQRILNEPKDYVVTPLSILFDKSLNIGKVHFEVKKASITPIFKQGNKFRSGNPRLLCLTSVVGTLMESTIRDIWKKSHHRRLTTWF